MEKSPKNGMWDRTPTTIVIQSATQEEVLFCVRPELYAAMFICQRVYENEIIIISNVYKIMDNTGYSYSFKFSNLNENIFNDDNFDKNDNENIMLRCDF